MLRRDFLKGVALTALAAATKRPERVVGMHFFSPVPKMRLCEVNYMNIVSYACSIWSIIVFTKDS